MVKLFDENDCGYIEVEVEDFYCNDFPKYFARTGKDTYFHALQFPIYEVPRIFLGNKPSDGGNLILSPDERKDILQREPALKKFIFRYVGGNEFINNIERYCLWLVNATPSELRKSKELYRRLEGVRKMREASTAKPTREKATTPHLFFFISQPTTDYILIPQVSSSRREYIPMGFLTPDIIANAQALIVPGAKLWHFGVLTSFPHMAWMRMVAGRLRNDYRYSANVVYNNFPWPPFNREVERTALKILMTRRNYPDATFADLYDPLIMPKDLRKAHAENDRAVMDAYDFPKNMTEAQMQTAFLNLYERLKNFAELYNSVGT